MTRKKSFRRPTSAELPWTPTPIPERVAAPQLGDYLTAADVEAAERRGEALPTPDQEAVHLARHLRHRLSVIAAQRHREELRKFLEHCATHHHEPHPAETVQQLLAGRIFPRLHPTPEPQEALESLA